MNERKEEVKNMFSIEKIWRRIIEIKKLIYKKELEMNLEKRVWKKGIEW